MVQMEVEIAREASAADGWMGGATSDTLFRKGQKKTRQEGGGEGPGKGVWNGTNKNDR